MRYKAVLRKQKGAKMLRHRNRRAGAYGNGLCDCPAVNAQSFHRRDQRSRFCAVLCGSRTRHLAAICRRCSLLFGRIPKELDKAKWNGYTFEVIDMDHTRIDKILVTYEEPIVEQEEQK